MKPEVNKLTEGALQCPLCSSIGGADEGASDLWIKLAEKRLDNYLNGISEPIPMNEALKRIDEARGG